MGRFFWQLLYLLPACGILILLSISKISDRTRFPVLLVLVLLAGFYLFWKVEEWFIQWKFALAFLLSCICLLALCFGSLVLMNAASDPVFC